MNLYKSFSLCRTWIRDGDLWDWIMVWWTIERDVEVLGTRLLKGLLMRDHWICVNSISMRNLVHDLNAKLFESLQPAPTTISLPYLNLFLLSPLSFLYSFFVDSSLLASFPSLLSLGEIARTYLLLLSTLLTSWLINGESMSLPSLCSAALVVHSHLFLLSGPCGAEARRRRPMVLRSNLSFIFWPKASIHLPLLLIHSYVSHSSVNRRNWEMGMLMDNWTCMMGKWRFMCDPLLVLPSKGLG